MGVLSSVLVSLITAGALALGVLLGHIAKEELKPGKKYIALLVPATMSIALLFTAISFALHPFMYTLIIIGAILLCCYCKINKYIIIGLLALLFAINVDKDYFLPVASLIFISNLAGGTEIYMKKGWKRNLIYMIILFLVIANLPLFLA